MNVRLSGGRVLDPGSGIDEVRDVFLIGGVIGTEAAWTGGEEVDCTGRWICPGFVDLYADLADHFDAESALRGGFTTVACLPLGQPEILRDRATGLAEIPVRVLPVGALTVDGSALAEMGLLIEAGAVAISQGRQTVSDSASLLNALSYAARFDRPVLLRPTDESLEASGVVRAGPQGLRVGLRQVPAEAEAIGVWQAALLAGRCGARVHLTHLSTALGVRALRGARAAGLPVTGSTTAAHLAAANVPPYAGSSRFLPPLGDERDRAALADGLRDGTLLAVATDHRPCTPVRQQVPIASAVAGAIGFETALPLVLSALDGADAIRALTAGPASVMGISATLTPGAVADVVLIDPSAEWTFRAEDDASRGSNSALDGTGLRGRVDRLWVGGRLLVTPRAPAR